MLFGFEGPLGVRSGSVRANFGLKVLEPETFNFKIFELCGRRRHGGSLLAAVPNPAARRAPAAAATAAQLKLKMFVRAFQYGAASIEEM